MENVSGPATLFLAISLVLFTNQITMAKAKTVELSFKDFYDAMKRNVREQVRKAFTQSKDAYIVLEKGRHPMHTMVLQEVLKDYSHDEFHYVIEEKEGGLHVYVVPTPKAVEPMVTPSPTPELNDKTPKQEGWKIFGGTAE